MRIVSEVYNVRCDMPSCKNKSDMAIEVDDNKRHNIHICTSCFDELYDVMSKVKTPKSVENIVKKAEMRRYEWNKR